MLTSVIGIRGVRVVAALGAAGLLTAGLAGVAAAQGTTGGATRGASRGDDAPPVQATGAAMATARLADRDGRLVGVVSLMQTPQGVLATGTVSGLTPGRHGIHIHEVGRCDPPAFTSAGGHFNPTSRQHGLRNPAGPHVGDLDNLSDRELGSNLLASARGLTTFRTLAAGATLGGEDGLLAGDGSAIVVHAGADDNVTDPAGASGDRVACGVVAAGAAGLPRTGTGTGGATGYLAGGSIAAGIGLMVAGLVQQRRRPGGR
jgi:Cu-Zn family superoxide dismutase